MPNFPYAMSRTWSLHFNNISLRKSKQWEEEYEEIVSTKCDRFPKPRSCGSPDDERVGRGHLFLMTGWTIVRNPWGPSLPHQSWPQVSVLGHGEGRADPSLRKGICYILGESRASLTGHLGQECSWDDWSFAATFIQSVEQMSLRASSSAWLAARIMKTEMNKILSQLSEGSQSSNQEVMRSVVVVGSLEELASAGQGWPQWLSWTPFCFSQQLDDLSGSMTPNLSQTAASQSTANTWAPCWLQALNTAKVSRGNCWYQSLLTVSRPAGEIKRQV